MGWIELAAGAVLGWFIHVAQVKWADRRAEEQLHVDLSKRAAAFLNDLRQIWRDVRNGQVIEDRRIAGLEQGVEEVARILERIMVVRDAGMRGRLTIWYLRARGVADDIRLFNLSRAPGADPRTLLAARPRIEWVIEQGQEFEPVVDVLAAGPEGPLELRARPPGQEPMTPGRLWAWMQRGIGRVAFTAVTSLVVSLATLGVSRYLDARKSAHEAALLDLQAEAIASQLTREWAAGKVELDSVRQRARVAAKTDTTPSQRAWWADEERWRAERLDRIDLVLAVRQGRRPRTVALGDTLAPARVADLRVSGDPRSELLYFIALARVLLAVQGIHVQSVSVKAIPDKGVTSPARP